MSFVHPGRKLLLHNLAHPLAVGRLQSLGGADHRGFRVQVRRRSTAGCWRKRSEGTASSTRPAPPTVFSTLPSTARESGNPMPGSRRRFSRCWFRRAASSGRSRQDGYRHALAGQYNSQGGAPGGGPDYDGGCGQITARSPVFLLYVCGDTGGALAGRKKL